MRAEARPQSGTCFGPGLRRRLAIKLGAEIPSNEQRSLEMFSVAVLLRHVSQVRGEFKLADRDRYGARLFRPRVWMASSLEVDVDGISEFAVFAVSEPLCPGRHSGPLPATPPLHARLRAWPCVWVTESIQVLLAYFGRDASAVRGLSLATRT